MSTSFYALKDSITKLHVEMVGGRAHLSIWVSKEKAGTLTMPESNLTGLLWCFKGERQFVRTGRALYPTPDKRMPSDFQLISEYGELMTLAELLKESAE